MHLSYPLQRIFLQILGNSVAWRYISYDCYRWIYTQNLLNYFTRVLYFAISTFTFCFFSLSSFILANTFCTTLRLTET